MRQGDKLLDMRLVTAAAGCSCECSGACAEGSGGAGHQHDDMKSEHMEIMKRHQALAKRLQAESKHHNELISSILKLTREHAKTFHDHDDSKIQACVLADLAFLLEREC